MNRGGLATALVLTSAVCLGACLRQNPEFDEADGSGGGGGSGTGTNGGASGTGSGDGTGGTSTGGGASGGATSSTSDATGGSGTGATSASSTGTSGCAWLDQSWPFRKRIAFDAGQVAVDLVGFPALVNLPADADLAAKAKADGGDILFATCNGAGKLDHEIESYDGGAGGLVAWVEVPLLSASGDTVLHMYYGNPAAASQWDVAATWDEGGAASFVGVWHLAEEQPGTGAAGVYRDSTANANHGDDHVSATDQDGRVGPGQEFDGVNDYVDLGDRPEFELTVYSWSMWLKGVAAPIAGGSNEQPLWNADDQFNFSWSHFVPEFTQAAAHRDASGWEAAAIASPLAGHTWYYVAATYDGSDLRVHLNGTLEGATPAGPPSFQSGPFTLGAPMGGGVPFPGHLDEVRVSSVVRSVAWIASSYANQSSPATFHTVGPEETP